MHHICDHNQGAGDTLIQVLSQHLPNISMEKVMRMELGELPEEDEFPVVWLTETSFKKYVQNVKLFCERLANI